MKYLIVGLGNPEPKYELTRHNIGFLIADQVAGDQIFKQVKFGSMSETRYKGRRLYVLKPDTYMNLSGKAVRYWLQELKIPVENLLVVTDDIALPFGKIRLKPKGSNGGHNGLGNIQDLLGTTSYPRLRFGVGGDFPKGKQVDYVLSNFDKPELVLLEEHIKKSVEAVHSFCTIGMERTMNFFN